MSSVLKPSSLGYVRLRDVASGSHLAELTDVIVHEAVLADDGRTIPAGSVGTIVGMWQDGKAYEVEFSDNALATVEARMIAPM